MLSLYKKIDFFFKGNKMLEGINTVAYKFNKGHILYKPGNIIKDNSVFLIKEGLAEFNYQLNRGKIFKVKIPSGGIFGLFEVMSGEKKRVAEVKFLEDTVLYMWKKEDFLMSASMISELGMKAIGFMSAFLRSINIKIQDLK